MTKVITQVNKEQLFESIENEIKVVLGDEGEISILSRTTNRLVLQPVYYSNDGDNLIGPSHAQILNFAYKLKQHLKEHVPEGIRFNCVVDEMSRSSTSAQAIVVEIFNY